MPARRMGCWMLRRVVRGVVIGPEGAIVAIVSKMLRFRVVSRERSEEKRHIKMWRRDKVHIIKVAVVGCNHGGEMLPHTSHPQAKPRLGF
jgi:hypothetical protein